MNLKLMSAIMLSVFASSAFSEVFQLNEKSLQKQISDETPEVQKIESELFSAKSRELKVKDQLTPQLYAGYQRINTNERAIIPFMPIWSPITQYEIGVRKKFDKGITASLSASVDSRSAELSSVSGSATTYDDATTLIYSLNISVDLWKDLFGKLTSAQIESAEVAKKSSEIQATIQKKAFSTTARRVYWALVGNNEKKIIAQRLLQTAKKQAKDAINRKANNIADEGEVARYESQVYARQGSLLRLEYERENLLKQLRTLVPSLNNKEILLSDYNLNKTLFDVLNCTKLIASESTVPFAHTQYDEIASLIHKVEKYQKKIDESYDDIDLKLIANYKITGVGNDKLSDTSYEGSLDKAMEDINDNDRTGLTAGLSLTIPLGNTKKQASEATKIYNQKKFQAQRREINFNLINTYEQVSKSINVLVKVLEAQKMNSQKLEIRLKDMQKKYNQARISVTALIQDQDAKMNSDLAVIDTQLAAVNTLLDYFIVFTETPCGFNRI